MRMKRAGAPPHNSPGQGLECWRTRRGKGARERSCWVCVKVGSEREVYTGAGGGKKTFTRGRREMSSIAGWVGCITLVYCCTRITLPWSQQPNQQAQRDTTPTHTLFLYLMARGVLVAAHCLAAAHCTPPLDCPQAAHCVHQPAAEDTWAAWHSTARHAVWQSVWSAKESRVLGVVPLWLLLRCAHTRRLQL